ncbi:hypothetical protein [Noviherbaspirillum massiliense]|uniref:hypothetical protein n=1 Tax=Noviherbaspirillum massiliense TaxID=1465823 RepID=UPI00037431A2|nr:hypothetical protein [Noviherbaspirillum massiliense]
MEAAAMVQSGSMESTQRVGAAWGFFWRWLLAASCTTIAGVIVGVALGCLIALNDVASNFNSWGEIGLHYMEMLREVLTLMLW